MKRCAAFAPALGTNENCATSTPPLAVSSRSRDKCNTHHANSHCVLPSKHRRLRYPFTILRVLTLCAETGSLRSSRVKREDLVETQDVPKLASAEPAEQTERREYTRVPVSVDVEIVDNKTGVRISGRATDFGVGGCYVDTLNTLPKGTPVELFLSWQGRTLQMHALVSYAVRDRSIGMGLTFIGTSDQSGVSLLDWMAGLSHDPSGRVQSRRRFEAAPQVETHAQSARHPRQALHELLVLLAQKHVLSESEVTQLFRLLEATSTAEQER